MVLSVATEKILGDTTGIDPEAVRLVAQCLNHYATPGPNAAGSRPVFNKSCSLYHVLQFGFVALDIAFGLFRILCIVLFVPYSIMV